MNSNIKLLLIALLTLGAIACRTVDPTPIPVPPTVTPPSPGTANFAKYVAIGNSLTAGFANGGLYREGQLVAYPNLLAQQFARAGGGAFVQPLFSTAKKDGSGYLRLINIPLTGLPNLQPYAPAGSIAVIGLGGNGVTPIYEEFTGANQNLGVPGIQMSDVTTDGYGFKDAPQFNNYFERLVADGSQLTTSYLDYVTTQSAGATFFTCWMGNNDALGYAISGGLVPFTPDGAFTANLQALLNALPSTAKGVIAAIPQVTKAAFFKTITESLILGQVNAGLPMGVPPFADLYVETAGGPKAMGATDFLLIGSQTHYANIGRQDFGAGAPFPYGLHPNNPIITQHVLDATEVTAVTNQINAYNAILQAEATTRNLAFYDPNIVLTQAETTGFMTNGLTFTTTFITGGLVSLDGIHLTPAGNAVVANEMIKVINAKYGATIPLLNVANYKTLEVVYQ